ncbi:pyridoxamine 5'-phosphate oxidase family protein [Actinomadura barringtoniae]|uniref:Pyridoxamine 5'-phosphate oxidase family protein n=1 Tax=Actinomadura barringtoniae TaxID=1427535 RepID=A0A939P6F6_9ACTN|nr:pyridoxamine 5'-phosphate oxidase family protein [Actinomadura barringtoniae]MBO2446367.1 pyridoxamine 5'-phosphate oxidase family protein [Actinomadura barringtoniae]
MKNLASLERPRDSALRTVRGLGAEECGQLLKPGGAGRVLVSTAHGRAAIPVHFVMFGDAIVFRAPEGSELASVAGAGLIGFEVERVAEADRDYWSVQVTGMAERVAEPATVWLLDDLIKPWPPGRDDVCVRIDPVHISGCHVRTRRRRPSGKERTIP